LEGGEDDGENEDAFKWRADLYGEGGEAAATAHSSKDESCRMGSLIVTETRVNDWDTKGIPAPSRAKSPAGSMSSEKLLNVNKS
jgi:hypothetical protein